MIWKRTKRAAEISKAYQLGFDSGAQWGYNTGRWDEQNGRPKYAGIRNVVRLVERPDESGSM